MVNLSVTRIANCHVLGWCACNISSHSVTFVTVSQVVVYASNRHAKLDGSLCFPYFPSQLCTME